MTFSITTLSITTFSIKKLSIKGLFEALRTKDLFAAVSINDTQHK